MPEAPCIDVAARLDALGPEHCPDEAARYEAREAARRLLARLETPFEQAFSLTATTPTLVASLEICRDLGLWARWHAADALRPGEPRSLADLLAMCDVPADANLVRRLLKHIAALHVLRETDVDTWAPTPYSLALGDDASHLGRMLACGTDQVWPLTLHLPEFLRRHGYAEPLDPTRFDNWTEVNGRDFFASHRADPRRGDDFNAYMTATRNWKTPWTDVYDAARFVDGARDDLGRDGAPPLFVDVGCCHGLDGARLLDRYPDLPAGAVVAQDLPAVLAAEIAALDPRVVKMPHDFFTPQPVRGARAYFLRAVLHDWSDADCQRILAHTVEAMTPGYSRLLVYDVVIPPAHASPFQTALDLSLMSVLCGLERTEDQWRRLLEAAGLRILNIFRQPRAVETLIEAELA